MNDMKKKIIRGVAVLAIAGAAGHFVQQSAATRRAPERAAQALVAKPTNIETVVATDKQMASTPAAAAPAMEPKLTVPQVTSLPSPDVAAAPVPKTPTIPLAIEPVPAPILAGTPAPAPALADADCTPILDLLSDDMAMIGVTLIAPCHGNQEFTLRHSGLVVAQTTNDKGSFFAFIPALTRDGAVSVTFKDGEVLNGAVEVPALDGIQRVSVIWQAPDVFGIQALEDGAVYGDQSAISADTPQIPAPGTIPTSGYLTRIGGTATGDAVMADVYTYPIGTNAQPQILIEAAVTPDACDREVYAELVRTAQGKTSSEELVVTLPECGGENGFLVLNIPSGEQSIAALN